MSIGLRNAEFRRGGDAFIDEKIAGRQPDLPPQVRVPNDFAQSSA